MVSPKTPQEVSPSPVLSPASPPALPKISIAALRKKTPVPPPTEEKKVTVLEEVPIQELTEFNLMQAWMTYARTKENDPRLRSLLEQQTPQLEGTTLHVELVNQLQRPIFDEEKIPLLNYLKKRFPPCDLELTITVNEEKEAPQAYTSTEKWDVLKEKYPLLIRLKERLKLDFD